MPLGVNLGLGLRRPSGAESAGSAYAINYGALTPSGAGAVPVTAADGTYGEFDVASNVATPNTSPLTPGAVTVGDTTITVVASAVTVANLTELEAVRDGSVAGATSPLTCYIAPGAEIAVRDRTFTSQRSNIVYRSCDATRKGTIDGWNLNQGGTLANIEFRELNIHREHPSRDDYYWGLWNPGGGNAIILADVADMTGLVIDSCDVDGGLLPVQEGEYAQSVDPLLLTQSTNFSDYEVTNNTIRRLQSGIRIGSTNGLIAGNDFLDVQGDAIGLLPRAATENANIIIRNNFYDPSGADNTGFHGDFIQPQWGGSVENCNGVTVEGNIVAPLRIMWGQNNPTYDAGNTLNTSTSDTITVATHNGVSIEVGGAIPGDPPTPNPLTTNVTYTLPDPTTCEGAQFCFRFISRTASETVAFDLGGATWVGGTPSLTETNTGVTFVSDGTSEWKRVRPGFRNWWFERKASFTGSDIDAGFVIMLNGASNAVTMTLPDATTWAGEPFFVNCCDDTNACTVAAAGSDVIDYYGDTGLSSITTTAGKAWVLTPSAGKWTIEEVSGASQVIFSGAPPTGSKMKDWTIRGNIFWTTSGKGIQTPQNNADQVNQIENWKIYNNTILYTMPPDLDGNGEITPFEGLKTGDLGSIWTSADCKSYNNVTTGSIVFQNGGQDLGSLALSISEDKSGLPPASLTALFSGTSRAAYYPSSKAEAISMAAPKAGGGLDGTGIGAHAVWNFDTGTEITSGLPAPTLSASVPSAGETFGTTGPIRLSFGQFLTVGTGNVVLRDITATPSVVETFDIAAGTGDNGGTISVTDTQIIITAGAALTDGNTYAVRADAGVVDGQYGVEWGGIADDTTVYFTADAAVPGVFVSAEVGTSDYWTKSGAFTAPSGLKDKLVVAFYGHVDYATAPDDGERHTVFFMEDGNRDFAMAFNESDNEVQFTAPGGTNMTIAGQAPSAGTSKLILFSMDRTAATADEGLICYIDGARYTPTASAWPPPQQFEPSGVVTQDTFRHPTLSRKFLGNVGMLYIDVVDTLIDLDDAAVRALFEPHRIGSDGSGPSGSAPLFFMTGNTAAWATGTQLGAGGSGYTVSGFV